MPLTAMRGFWWRAIVLGILASAVAILAIYVYWFRAPYAQIADVVYGTRDGKPLLMDVFRPPQQNGAGILVLISGSWKSSSSSVQPLLFAPLLRRGYTVIAVRHISQPECLIQDITKDIHRAVRFTRYHAADYGIDPDRLGVVGGSSGGHLTLHVASCGDQGNPLASDPVEKTPSSIQCAACFYPVTDLLNLGKSTENAGDGGPPKSFVKGFGDEGKSLDTWKILGKKISPIYHVDANLPPVYIIHGDADTLVPLEQSEWFAARAAAAGRPIKLDVRPGKKHGWPTMLLDIVRFANWFDRHLDRSSQAPAN